LNRMMFPGHGLSLLQLSEPVALNAIEVPKMAEDRWVTAVPHGDHWLVIDDFVWPVAKGDIRRAECDGKRLRYYDGAGVLLRGIYGYAVNRILTSSQLHRCERCSAPSPPAPRR